MNKRGSNFLFDQIIFLVIIVAFAVIMIVFVARFGNSAGVKEQIYSKQIALTIDKARAGTQFTLDVSDIYKTANKNKFIGKYIEIDNLNKKVNLQLSSGKGYSYGFFSDNPISWNINDTNPGEEKLMIFVGEGT
jgi:hypothetical protein